MPKSRALHSGQIILQVVVVVDCEVRVHFVGVLGRHSIRVLNGCKGSRYLLHPRTRHTLTLMVVLVASPEYVQHTLSRSRSQ